MVSAQGQTRILLRIKETIGEAQRTYDKFSGLHSLCDKSCLPFLHLRLLQVGGPICLLL